MHMRTMPQSLYYSQVGAGRMAERLTSNKDSNSPRFRSGEVLRVSSHMLPGDALMRSQWMVFRRLTWPGVTFTWCTPPCTQADMTDSI